MSLKTTLLAAALCITSVQGYNKVIYGNDDRRDIVDATNQTYLDLAKSTAAMISGNRLNTRGKTVKISGSALRLCSDEQFNGQPTAANCSGFLVGPDLLVTAGHCIRSASDCRSYKWVFDFAKTTSNQTEYSVPKESVYGCKEIIERSLDNRTSDDYALIRLDRAVNDRNPLEFRTEGKVSNNANLVVIGHPSGLPTKIADGATVRNNRNGVYFSANLDTYGGNSGSAVFNADTGVVEGILVRGETDYTYDSNRGCRMSYRCQDNGCRGEDVTRITNIKAL